MCIVKDLIPYLRVKCPVCFLSAKRLDPITTARNDSGLPPLNNLVGLSRSTYIKLCVPVMRVELTRP